MVKLGGGEGTGWGGGETVGKGSAPTRTHAIGKIVNGGEFTVHNSVEVGITTAKAGSKSGVKSTEDRRSRFLPPIHDGLQ